MFWHYGIEIEYMTLRRTDEHGAHVRPRPREVTGVEALEMEMRCVAGGDIAWRRVGNFDVLEDKFLLSGFRAGLAWVRSNPGLDPPFDDAIFAYFGIARDEEIAEARVDAPTGPESWLRTGPESWLRVWREAEHLIRGELWPAVRAVAEEARKTEADLTGDQIAAIAEAALGRAA